MSIATLPTELPILTAGLPRAVTETLTFAGIPFRSYRSGTSFHDFLLSEPGRFVLYDSRKITSRLEAETALGYERDILDIAPESPSGIGISPQDERNWTASAPAWIENLKSCLLAKGGMWLRLHELPARYEGVLFTGGLPQDESLGNLGDMLQVAPTENGFIRPPHFGIDHVLGDDSATQSLPIFGCWWSDRVVPHGTVNLNSPEARLWRPASDEFVAWWHYRNSLRISLRQTAAGIEILADGFRADERTPILEVWRNEHVARIPLAAGRIELAHDNLVFAREPFRHPAGLFVSQGHADIPASGIAGRNSAPLLKTW